MENPFLNYLSQDEAQAILSAYAKHSTKLADSGIADLVATLRDSRIREINAELEKLRTNEEKRAALQDELAQLNTVKA